MADKPGVMRVEMMGKGGGGGGGGEMWVKEVRRNDVRWYHN